ncbi:MAG: hypothetical protein ACK56W_12085 [Pirellula sp.]|jgi:hypothetical protein|nr:hypothetical protein [Pirellula sp.]
MKNIPRTGLVLSLGGIVYLFFAATVLYPCIPFPDPTGETVFLSRLDYVLAVLGHPEAVWGQWLGAGDAPHFFDRVPILLRAVATIAVCWSLGRSLVAWDKLEAHMPRAAHFAISIIIGYLIVNISMSILHRWFRIDHWFWPGLALIISYGILWLLKRFRCDCRHPDPKRARGILYLWSLLKSHDEHKLKWKQHNITDVEAYSDSTFEVSWKRRLFGLCSISILAVFCIQILGACLPTVDQDVRRDVWWQLVSKSREGDADKGNFQNEDAKLRTKWLSTKSMPTIDYVSALWLWESSHGATGSNTRGTSDELPSYLIAVVTSKVMVTVVAWLGFVLIAAYVNETYGKLPALLILLLLGCTPCFIELERLGRVESVYGVIMASIPMVVRYSYRTGVVPIGCLTVLSLPMLVWVANCFMMQSDSEYLRPEATARFIGFSMLYAVAFVPLVVVGLCSRYVVRPDGGMERWMAAIAMSVFVILGLVCTKMDRCWVPCLCLLSFAAARGISILVRDQPGWLGLPMWICIMLFAVVDGVALPTIDNRVLASYSEIVLGQWQYRESLSDQSDVSERYTMELRSQLSDGKLGESPRLLLIGDWDDLDLPMECSVWLSRSPEELPEELNRLMERGMTHVALVSATDREERLLSLEDEQRTRLELEKIAQRGRLHKMDVSPSCRELVLYVVSFVDSPSILSDLKSNP